MTRVVNTVIYSKRSSLGFPRHRTIFVATAPLVNMDPCAYILTSARNHPFCHPFKFPPPAMRLILNKVGRKGKESGYSCQALSSWQMQGEMFDSRTEKSRIGQDDSGLGWVQLERKLTYVRTEFGIVSDSVVPVGDPASS